MIDSIEQQKHAKKTEYLYAQLPNIGSGNIIAACLLVAIYWTQLNHGVLIVWLLAVIAVISHRFYAARAFRRRDRYASTEGWYKIYANGVLINGCLWGAVGIFIAHQSSSQQLPYLLMILGALVACASITNNALFSSYKLFAIPAMVPLGIYLMTQFSSEKFMMGLLVLCWSALMYSTASRFNKFVSTSLGFEFENVALLRQVEAGRAQIKELKKNNTLQEASIKNLQKSGSQKGLRYVSGSRLATAEEKNDLRVVHK